MIFTTSESGKLRHNLAKCERFQSKTSTCWKGENFEHVYQIQLSKQSSLFNQYCTYKHMGIGVVIHPGARKCPGGPKD